MPNRAFLARDALLSALFAVSAGVHCGSSNDATDPSGSGGTAGDASAGAGGTPVATPDAAPNEGPCSQTALNEPQVATTYYVAINEPGADNTACDGLAATDEGGGHCPFKDFSAPRTQALLDGVQGVRVNVRAGTYVITGWEGLRITGAGTSEAERVVLSAYNGEDVIIDTASPDGAGCTATTAQSNPVCVREVIRVSGQYTVVQGLTIQNGLAYQVEVTGGAHHLVRCNLIRETVEFPMRSDMMKLDGGTTDVEVLHNEFTNWHSQAIDMTEVQDVLIEGNDFHHPFDADGGASGSKFGARNVIIRGNTVHDLGNDPMTHAFSLGGTGSPHPDDHEAYGIEVVQNRIWNVEGIAAQFVSCLDCAFEDNDVWDVGAGVLLSAAATGLPECSASASGCGASSGARFRGNRMRNMQGGADPASANIFLVAEAGEGADLTAGENLYCAPSADAARFGWLGQMLTFAEWTSASGTDATSATAASSDARCIGW